MGRTNPTYREQLRAIEEHWQAYRRTLRRPHRPPFDDLFEIADRFAAPAGTQNPADPYRAVLFSIDLGQEIERQRLEARVDALETAVEDALQD